MTAHLPLIGSHLVSSALLATYLCACAPIHGQDMFYAHYATTGPQTGGHITPSPDNGFYGVTSNSMLDRIYCYKIDAQADLVWFKEISIPVLSVPTAIATLSDSSFAFLVAQFGADPSVVFKVSATGDLQWSITLYNPDGWNFHDLAPTTDGGMLLTGSGCADADMILHLSPQGHILSQHGHASWNSAYSRPNARKIIHDGNDQYSYLGHAYQPGSGYRPLIYCRSDSAGNVYSYLEIHFPYGISSSVPWGETLVRSASGGHYLTTMVDDTAMNHVVLCYLNAQDQLEWFKEIATPDLRMTADALVPTADGGCVLMGGTVVNITPYLYHTYAIKFNEQGDLLWSKKFGDVNVPFWDRLGIQNVVPAGPDAFMTVPVRWSQFDFCRVDTAFNGYCYEQSFLPLVTGVDPTVIPYPITPTTILFIEATIMTAVVPNSYPRSNLCAAYTGIEEAEADLPLTLAPNPASDHVQQSIPLDRPQPVEVSVTTSLGAVCFTRQVAPSPGSPMVIPTRDLPAGAYIVAVRAPDLHRRARLIVQH